MHLTLLVPELLWPEPADTAAWDDLRLPGLEWILGRSTLHRAPPLPFEHCLAAAWNRSPEAPLAALRLLGESVTGSLATEGVWVCADPVHLRFHHERIVLADAGAFELSAAEAAALVTDLNREFAELGHFHATDPRRWHLRLNQPALHAAPPLSAVAGRRLDRDAPGSASTLRAVQNEIQMMLHGHPVNAARAASGLPTVNGLWLWGSGALDQAPAAPFALAAGTTPLAAGLARAAGANAIRLPENLDALMAAAPAGSCLVVLDAALAPVLYEDATRWRTVMAELDATWFAPASRALGRSLRSLTLSAPTLYGVLHWNLCAGDRWRIWRRPVDPAYLARSLAA
jgi:hypothetical protein